jgi:hypothetical protein
LQILARARRRSQNFAGGHAPGAVGARDQTLRNDKAEGLRETRADDGFFVFRVEADDAVDRLRGVDGVQSGQHEVASFGGFKRDLGRLEVTHLADQDHLWRLTESSAQG